VLIRCCDFDVPLGPVQSCFKKRQQQQQAAAHQQGHTHTKEIQKTTWLTATRDGQSPEER
jgi:hypothetical protein